MLVKYLRNIQNYYYILFYYYLFGGLGCFLVSFPSSFVGNFFSSGNISTITFCVFMFIPRCMCVCVCERSPINTSLDVDWSRSVVQSQSITADSQVIISHHSWVTYSHGNQLAFPSPPMAGTIARGSHMTKTFMSNRDFILCPSLS